MDALITNLDLSPTTIVPLARFDLNQPPPILPLFDLPLAAPTEDGDHSTGQPSLDPAECGRDSEPPKQRRPTVSDLLRRYGPAYLEKHGHELPDYVTRVLTTIVALPHTGDGRPQVAVPELPARPLLV